MGKQDANIMRKTIDKGKLGEWIRWGIGLVFTAIAFVMSIMGLHMSEESLAQSRRNTELSQRPVLIIRADAITAGYIRGADITLAASPEWKLSLVNIGNGSALNGTIKITDDAIVHQAFDYGITINGDDFNYVSESENIQLRVGEEFPIEADLLAYLYASIPILPNATKPDSIGITVCYLDIFDKQYETDVRLVIDDLTWTSLRAKINDVESLGSFDAQINIDARTLIHASDDVTIK